MSIQFGTFVPQGWRMDLVDIADPVEKYEAMTQVGLAAERAGYDSIWVYDHFHTVPTPELEACFEAWTITAALARDHGALGRQLVAQTMTGLGTQLAGDRHDLEPVTDRDPVNERRDRAVRRLDVDQVQPLEEPEPPVRVCEADLGVP